MMISNLKNIYGLPGLHKNISAVIVIYTDIADQDKARTRPIDGTYDVLYSLDFPHKKIFSSF